MKPVCTRRKHTLDSFHCSPSSTASRISVQIARTQERVHPRSSPAESFQENLTPPRWLPIIPVRRGSVAPLSILLHDAVACSFHQSNQRPVSDIGLFARRRGVHTLFVYLGILAVAHACVAQFLAATVKGGGLLTILMPLNPKNY